MNNRILTETLELPNGLNKLSFKPNTLSDKVGFQERIEKLYNNYNYIKSSATFINNLSPKKYDRVYDFNDGWKLVSDGGSGVNHDYISIHRFDREDGSFGYILVKVDSIEFAYGEDIINYGNFTPINTNRVITTIKTGGTQKFSNITTTLLDKASFYVYDEDLRVVVVYNITNFINDDVVTSGSDFIIKIVNLEGLISICSDGGGLYLLTKDRLIQSSKMLNFITETHLNLSEGDNVVNLEGGVDSIFILTEEGRILKYSRELEHLGDYKLSVLPDGGVEDKEVFSFIKKSKLNSDIYLIMSNRTIYKVFVDKIGKYFSHFNINTGKDFRSFDNFVVDNEEVVLILDEDKINLTIDRNDEVSLYSLGNLRDEFNLEELGIDDLELEQDFTYNTVIQKIKFNHILLYNSLLYKASVNIQDNMPVFKGLLNLKRKPLTTINTEFGINEVFSYSVFQRFIKDIYRIQLNMIELLEPKVDGDFTIPLVI